MTPVSDLIFQTESSEEDGLFQIDVFAIQNGPNGREKILIAASEGFTFSSKEEARAWSGAMVRKWMEDHLSSE